MTFDEYTAEIHVCPACQASTRALAETVLVTHQRRDIRGCTCGKWGSDHGHMGQSHPGHVIDELERAGIRLVEVPK